jgi:hypothetical protein
MKEVVRASSGFWILLGGRGVRLETPTNSIMCLDA